MLSNEEKREMLDDAKSALRRDNFRAANKIDKRPFSFDDFLLFLENIQKIFPPFKISRHITHTKLNKL